MPGIPYMTDTVLLTTGDMATTPVPLLVCLSINNLLTQLACQNHKVTHNSHVISI